MPLTVKEISILRVARANADLAWKMQNKWEYGQTISQIVDLGIPVMFLFVSDEVFEKSIKEE